MLESPVLAYRPFLHNLDSLPEELFIEADPVPYPSISALREEERQHRQEIQKEKCRGD